MRLQRLGALPLLDYQERVLAIFRWRAFGVDRRSVLDAAGLGMHRRHVCPELLQDRFPHARLGGDDGDDMDHGSNSRWVSRHPTPDRGIRQVRLIFGHKQNRCLNKMQTSCAAAVFGTWEGWHSRCTPTPEKNRKGDRTMTSSTPMLTRRQFGGLAAGAASVAAMGSVNAAFRSAAAQG